MSRSKLTSAEVGNRILIGLIFGTIIGLLFNSWGANFQREWVLSNLIQPVGNGFLRGLYAVVVPLVFSSLVIGITQLGSAQHVGRLGWRLMAYYVVTTVFAAALGLTLVKTLRPGDGIDPSVVEAARSAMSAQVEGLLQKSEATSGSLWPEIVSGIIPRNVFDAMASANMLAVIFSAFVFGLALLGIPSAKREPILKVFDGVYEACIAIVGWVMRNAAPYCIAALMINALTYFGLELMYSLLKYIGVALLGCAIHFCVTYPLLIKNLVRIPLKQFYKRGSPAILTAFSTASSSATMPTTMHTLEKRFGVPESVTTFSIPIGTTINMDGTAIFSIIASLFVAQVFGTQLTFASEMSLAIVIVFTSIGVAGVPGGLTPLLMAAMASAGIDPAGIAIILGVDRLLDMARTCVNVTGDMTCALFLSRVENVPLEKNFTKIKI